MERLNNVLGQVRKYLKELGPTQKLLVASLCVIVGMTMFLVTQYAGRGKLVELMAEDPQQPVLATLRSAGFKVETREGKIMVPASDRAAAIAQLSEAGKLPSDSTLLFGNLIGVQDWRNSAEKDRQQFIFALQNELGRVIGQFRDVRSASVIIHAPEVAGLGRASREPTASVTIFTSSGAPPAQATIDAAARLVAGARSGLMVRNVSVIDGSTGRSRKVTDDGDMVSSSYLEHQTVVERETREKLESLLSYIPGVMVAVTAQVDVTKVNSQIQKHLPKGEGTVSLVRRTEASSTSQSEASRAAEPGIRSNTQMDINQANGSTGTKLETEDTVEEMQNAIGVETTQRLDPRGMPTALAASINVPEDFIELLVRRSRGEGGEATQVARTDLDARFAEIEKQIINSVQPHLKTRLDDGSSNAGEVFVSMVPIPMGTLQSGVSEAGFLGVLSNGPIAMGGGVIEKVVLGALAMVAVVMMLMMVKRTGKQTELPTAQELVGVPPALALDADVIGEAEERDAPMAGIEIGEDDVKVQKMLEQVSELVEANPEGAANLLQRWIQVEE